MPDNTSEQIEREAREALVAADLSAKMKQWSDQSPPPPGNRNRGPQNLRLLLLLLVFGGAAWWLWGPTTPEKIQQHLEQPVQHPSPTPPQAVPVPPQQPKQPPIAQKPAANRYLALAQSNYQAPNFAAEIRGTTPADQNVLNKARQALDDHRFSDALLALQHVPPEYNSDAAYLRGHALFGLKKYARAATVFDQLAGSVRYGEAAQWYEILCLLPEFEQHKSFILNTLKKISAEQGHTFQQEAIALYRLL